MLAGDIAAGGTQLIFGVLLGLVVFAPATP
jgi:hypothetical protein